MSEFKNLNADPEVPFAKNLSFSDESVRKGFIRKVYSILTLQLAMTLAIMTPFVFHEPTRIWAVNHLWLLWVDFAILFVLIIALTCFESLRRTSPINVILLGLFTIAQSISLGVLSALYARDAVLIAVGITAVVTVGLTIFAFQTKWDFTMCGGFLFVLLLVLFVFGIITIFYHGKIVRLVYASLGALVFSFYLVFDTQLMMGGSHKYSIDPEEYIFAALNLYLDIVNLLIYILAIVGGSRD